LALRPAAKKGLLVIGVLYAITVAVMIASFVREARPRQPEAAGKRIQVKLNEVLYDLRHDPGEDGAAPGDVENELRADVEHVRSADITAKEAAEIFHNYFRARGKIVGMNVTLVVQWLNFGILLLILYGLLWDPLLKFLDERARTIKGRLDDAAASREEARRAVARHREELAKLRRERADILEQARSMGEQEGDQIVQRARREAERTGRRAQEELAEQVRAGRAALRAETADLAVAIAARILGREVSIEDHRRLAEELIEQIGAGPAESGGEG